MLDVARGLEYLHEMDMPHGGLRGVGYFVNPFTTFQLLACSIAIHLISVLSYAVVLTLWFQANVVVKNGHALLIEYGLTGINPDPSFLTLNQSYATNPRWTAPEIIRSRRGSDTPAPDLKRVDVFAFAMLAVEVFTGKVPFGGQADNNITFGIPNKKRPDKPSTNDQVGLTDEIWTIIESCWDDDPRRRPPIRDVVKKWPDSAQSTNRGSGLVQCVQIISVIKVPFLVSFSTFSGKFREPTNGHGEGSGHRRVKYNAPQPEVKHEAPQPEVKPEARRETSRPKVKHEAPQPEAKRETSRPKAKHDVPRPEMKYEAPQPEVKHEAPRPEVKHDAPQPEAKRETSRPKVKHEVSQPGAKRDAPQPEVKQEAPQSEVKHEAPQPEVKHEAPQPEAKRETSRPKVKHDAPRPEVKYEAPQPEAKHEASLPEVKHETSQSEGNHGTSRPKVKHEASEPEVKRNAPQPEVKHEAPQPEVKYEAPRPEVKHEAPQPEAKRETSRPKVKHEASQPEAKQETFSPGTKVKPAQSGEPVPRACWS